MILAHLGHLADSGHQVTIKANIVDTRFPLHPCIKIEKIRLPAVCGTILAAVFSKPSADCLVATIIPLAFCLYLRNREKVVYMAQEYEELGYRSLFSKFMLRLISRIVLTSFRIPAIAVSEKLGQFLHKEFHANFEIVPNGVDTGIYYQDLSPEILSTKDGNRSILIFSKNDKRKGFDIALDVVRKLKRESKIPFVVWIVGESTGIDVNDLPCQHFGFLDDMQMRKILSSADVFLYPSRTDGFGLIVAEAFACKCPVVTTPAVFFAKDGVNALVSSTGNVDDLAAKVIRLLEDKELGDQLARRGYDLVCDMSLKASSKRFETVLIALRRML